MKRMEKPLVTISTGVSTRSLLDVATEAMIEAFGADDPDIEEMKHRVNDAETPIDAYRIIEKYVDIISDTDAE